VTKLRVDQADVTLAELADIEEALGASLGVAFAQSSARAIAAVAWVTARRTDPTYTLAQALTLRMGDLDIVTPEDGPGEAPGGGNGTSPPASPAPGPSTPPT